MSRPVPADVLDELLLNVGLFPFWSADLRRPWWSFLPASDASPSFGFGFNIAHCSSKISRAVAAAAERHDCVIRLTLEDIDSPEVERAGPENRLPLTMSDFKPIFSTKAGTTAHSGAMELEGVKLGLLRICRSARHHGHRGAFLVDAQAVGFALRKGRSSAGSLRRGVCAVAAICLAADLKMSFPYLLSKSNPADFPSRGKVRKRSTLKRPPKRSFSPLDLLDRA